MQDIRIGDFTAWTIYVDPNQFFPGSCYLRPKREGVRSIDGLTSEEEFGTLRNIVPAWFNAVKKAYGADGYEFSFVGNGTLDFRVNLIPLYSNDKEKKGLEKHPNHPLFNFGQLMEVKKKLEDNLG